MLTQDDLQAIARLIKSEVDVLRKEMATKADLSGMATKDDIANMATKDDIANMATKDDIDRLDMKMDALFEINRREHTQLMEMIVDSNEEHGRRLDKLEEHTGLVKRHKN